MTELQKAVWSLGGAALVFAAGAVVAVDAIVYTGDVRDRLARKNRDILSLVAIDAELRPYASAFALIASTESGAADPVEVILRSSPDLAGKPEQHDEFTRIAQGWRLRRVEATWANVRFESLADVMREAESRRPPWRVASCTLRAAAGEKARGQAVLVLERIERSRP
jgi:hypothetical protein